MKGKQIAYSFLGTVIRAVILVVLCIVIFKIGGKAYEFGFRIFTEEPMSEPPGRDVQITVSKSDSMKDVAKVLEEKGVIRDDFLFRIQSKFTTQTNGLQPGIYTLNTSMTAEEMFAIIMADKDSQEEEEEEAPAAEPTPAQSLNIVPAAGAEEAAEGEAAETGEAE